MKQLSIVLSLLFVLSTGCAFGQNDNKEKNGLEWYTDVLKANERSQATHKPIFAFFTGSDWCGWCRKLQADVFSKKEFVKWAKEKVILVELDFPRTKQLPPALAQQNSELQRIFQVQGYPTCWLFFLSKNDSTNQFQISPLGSVGYPQGAELGKEQVKFLNDANQILAKNKAK